MAIWVFSPDPIVFGPPRPCRDVYCYHPDPDEGIAQFMLRHRFLGFRDILVVDDE